MLTTADSHQITRAIWIFFKTYSASAERRNALLSDNGWSENDFAAYPDAQRKPLLDRAIDYALYVEEWALRDHITAELIECPPSIDDLPDAPAISAHSARLAGVLDGLLASAYEKFRASLTSDRRTLVAAVVDRAFDGDLKGKLLALESRVGDGVPNFEVTNSDGEVTLGYYSLASSVRSIRKHIVRMIDAQIADGYAVLSCYDVENIARVFENGGDDYRVVRRVEKTCAADRVIVPSFRDLVVCPACWESISRAKWDSEGCCLTPNERVEFQW